MGMNLRSGPAGPLFLGENQNDAILWDVATRSWVVGAIPGGGGGVTSWNARMGAVVPETGDYDSDQVDNVSNVSGPTISDALDNLQDATSYLEASSTRLATGALLTDADETLAVSQRYVMAAGTTTAARVKSLTPSGTAARGFQLEIGTQDDDVTVQNDGPGGTSGLASYTVPAGQKFALFFVSDGTDVTCTAAMPLDVEPVV